MLNIVKITQKDPMDSITLAQNMSSEELETISEQCEILDYIDDSLANKLNYNQTS
jgi:hypothetical protein